MLDFKHTDITDRIIKSFYKVYNKLGYGFQEKVYANSLDIELQKSGLRTILEELINVYYENELVGKYYADILVNGLVIVEIKATRGLFEEHEAQLLNYLKATPYEVGLLLNFGLKPEIRRKAFDNSRKGDLSWIEKSVE